MLVIKKYIILLLSSILLSNLVLSQEISAQEMKSDVSKMAAHFQVSNYQISYNKVIYQDKSDQTPIEQSRGTFYFGISPNYRVEENSLLIIQNKDFSMTIDSLESKIFISKPVKNFSPVDLAMYQNDSILEAQKFTKRRENKTLIYTIASRDIDNGVVELYVNDGDFFVYKVNYYLPAGNFVQESLEDESIEHPLVVISYEPVKKKVQNSALFSVDQWINTSVEPFQVQANVSNFELIDLRYQPNTSK